MDKEYCYFCKQKYVHLNDFKYKCGNCSTKNISVQYYIFTKQIFIDIISNEEINRSSWGTKDCYNFVYETYSPHSILNFKFENPTLQFLINKSKLLEVFK